MMHLIILKNGDTVTGEIQDKNFTIKTSYATLKFSKDKIVHIHFKNPPQFIHDEILLKATDKIKGDVTPNILTIKLESSSQNIKINKNKIHTIMFLDNI